MKTKPLLKNVEILSVAAEGKALARVDGKALFVPYVIPGDVVDVQVCRKRSGYLEGAAVRIVRPSPLRREAACGHWGVCGGCRWQILPYPEQLKWKQQQVQDQLQRIGGISAPEVLPIIGSPHTEYYRNKLEFTFSRRRWVERGEPALQDGDCRCGLGFHIPERFDKVLDIRHCCLQPPPSNEIRNAIRQFAIDEGYSFFDIKKREGLLRTLIVRTSGTGEVMAAVVFFENDAPKIERMMQFIGRAFPQITSLFCVINGKGNDSIADCPAVCCAGRPYIEETMGTLRFRVGLNSFCQTNSEQARRLYEVVRDFAALDGSQTAYDLYCGAGTIGCFLASGARRVAGIEISAEAVDYARRNAEINGIGNAFFEAGDMKDVLTPDFAARHGHPDVAVIDPPRAGLHAGVISALMQLLPPRIVYVSCNPATQARDLALLSPRYRLLRSQPVDMFPHTHHVENVATLERWMP